MLLCSRFSNGWIDFYRLLVSHLYICLPGPDSGTDHPLVHSRATNFWRRPRRWWRWSPVNLIGRVAWIGQSAWDSSSMVVQGRRSPPKHVHLAVHYRDCLCHSYFRKMEQYITVSSQRGVLLSGNEQHGWRNGKFRQAFHSGLPSPNWYGWEARFQLEGFPYGWFRLGIQLAGLCGVLVECISESWCSFRSLLPTLDGIPGCLHGRFWRSALYCGEANQRSPLVYRLAHLYHRNRVVHCLPECPLPTHDENIPPSRRQRK